MSSVDTVCPVCWESVHGEAPVGVIISCGHVMHQSCYRDWQKRGEYTYEASSFSTSSSSPGLRRNYSLNFNLNCLICNQPAKSFVDLFIRLPAATKNYTETVTKLEHEFNTVCRRTQLSLEKEIARRDFEQTWLQEERQLNIAARQRTEHRHKQAVREMHRNLRTLKKEYQRKIRSMEERRNRKNESNGGLSQSLHSSQNSNGLLFTGSLQGSAQFSLDTTGNDEEEEEDSIHLDATENSTHYPEADSQVPTTATNIQEEEMHNLDGAVVVSPDESSIEQRNPTPSERRHYLADTIDPGNINYQGSRQRAQSNNDSGGDPHGVRHQFDQGNIDESGSSNYQEESQNIQRGAASLHNIFATDVPPVASAISPRREGSLSSAQLRTRKAVPKDIIFHPEGDTSAMMSPNRGRRSVLRDEIFAPSSMCEAIAHGAPSGEEVSTIEPSTQPGMHMETDETSGESCMEWDEHRDSTTATDCLASGKESSSLLARANDDDRKFPASYQVMDESENSLSTSDYELQRLQADSAFYQHQAELVEWERHQAEIELEQDELALRQREQRIRMERSLLEQSFTSIQRRVKESKREARDRQKLSALEEKYAKYKLARRREEERYEEELRHLEQDEIQIKERQQWEKERQEKEKARLKQEVNALLQVKKRLENEQELAKLAEERSSISDGNETCVVCFEPLVNDESELGVAVPCGHAFHCSCFNGWEKSKKKRSTPSVPCPLCNNPTNLCVAIRLNRPDCSLYCSAVSLPALTKHFQKQEKRWQRRRLTSLAGELSS